MAEYFMARTALGTDEITHVLDDPKDGNINFPKHAKALAGIDEGQILRGLNNNGARQRGLLGKGELNITSARRHIDNEAIEFTPDHLAEHLHEPVEVAVVARVGAEHRVAEGDDPAGHVDAAFVQEGDRLFEVVDTLVRARLDGQLDVAQTARIETYLAGNPAEQARIEAYARHKDVLRAALEADGTIEPNPPRFAQLEAKLAHRLRHRDRKPD
jgi:hypothetical protein